MIHISIEKCLSFIPNNKLFDDTLSKAHSALELLDKKIGMGSNWLGWRDILAKNTIDDMDKMIKIATSWRKTADIIIVCGVGGSYLGAKAIMQALSALKLSHKPKIVFIGHNLSSLNIKQVIDQISLPNPDGSKKSVCLIAISKSGTTLETMISFRLLHQWLLKEYKEDISKRIVCITKPTGGHLNDIANYYGYDTFSIPDDIGGRFSVLTPAGLFPLACANFDIETIFKGAQKQYRNYCSDVTEIIKYASVRYILHQEGYSIDALCSFHTELTGLLSWIQQLLGESEGKGGKGIFPATMIYTTDLHSMGQMMQQGNRNIMETCLNVNMLDTDIKISKLNHDIDKLNFLSRYTLNEINDKARKGTIQAHVEGGVPVIEVEINKLNEESMGRLVYTYELFTAIYVYMLEVNPFNQPGVEAYKRNMMALLT